MKRIHKAFLIAPVAPALICLLLSDPIVLLLAIPAAYGVALVIGAPLYLLVRRFWSISLLSCSSSGAAAGILTTILADGGLKTSSWFANGGIVVVIWGAISGAVFWWLLLDEMLEVENGP